MDRRVAIYLSWLGLTLLAALAVSGLDAKNITVLCAVALFAVELALLPVLRRWTSRLPAAPLFIGASVLAACCLEAFHMISTPFHPTLRITRDTGIREALGRLGVDLLFTVPAYVVIFWIVWRLACRYRLSSFGFLITISLGQMLGDGGLLFFVGAPWMLPFLPYAIVKYQAMTFVPHLLVQGRPVPGGQGSSGPAPAELRVWAPSKRAR